VCRGVTGRWPDRRYARIAHGHILPFPQQRVAHSDAAACERFVYVHAARRIVIHRHERLSWRQSRHDPP